MISAISSSGQYPAAGYVETQPAALVAIGGSAMLWELLESVSDFRFPSNGRAPGRSMDGRSSASHLP